MVGVEGVGALSVRWSSRIWRWPLTAWIRLNERSTAAGWKVEKRRTGCPSTLAGVPCLEKDSERDVEMEASDQVWVVAGAPRVRM